MPPRIAWGLIAAAVALWAIVTLARGTAPFAHPDSRSYWHEAHALVDHGEFRERFDTGTTPSTWRPPAYGATLSLALRTGLGPSAIARLQQLMLLATALLIAFVVRRLGATDRRAAVAGLIYLWLPVAGSLAGSLMSETLFMLLATGALACAVAGDDDEPPRRQLARLAAVGLLCGTALLTRTVFYALLPAIAYLAIARARRRWLATAMLALGFVAVVAPWTARNAALHGRFIPVNTAGAYNLYVGNVHDANGVKDPRTRAWLAELRSKRTEAQVAAELARRARAEIAARPGRTAARWLRNAARFWVTTKGVSHSRALQLTTAAVQLTLLLLAAIALARRRDRTAWALASAPLLLTLLHAVTFVDWRFALPAMPFLIALAFRASD